MRPGSRVERTKSFTYHGEWLTEHYGQLGTVISELTDTDCDGYESTIGHIIRWDDGSVSTIKEEDDITIDDVTPRVYANLYLYDRAYGGPQEGGWWYNTYEAQTPGNVDSTDSQPPQFGHFPSEEEAQAAYEVIDEWCKAENSNRRSPSSVLSEGHYTVILESWPAEHSPKYRPHYC